MPKITFVEYTGTEREIDLPSGLSVMQGAIDHQITGIDADCGGECACATCHVYVDPRWLERVGPQGAQEAALLDFAALAQPNSRLSCQIKMNDQLDGLVVSLPEAQH
ncbi:2Fe-2S iron-sulfur cluster-binding protein [Afipia sp. GAS231]|uniref:2Fe-2S iron-sulfur cluster-binding protein n=1 Tax=Afipia sp. GAS231 TaxID=1882747 RepID=UPI00087C0DF0|nr:2Fe-2S iron-sulfur cluster-binding protein [Afipia sp. GAS231]SDN13782.1 ferredoxin, 2Fe-2S [Afipia sp. GAS231]